MISSGEGGGRGGQALGERGGRREGRLAHIWSTGRTTVGRDDPRRRAPAREGVGEGPGRSGSVKFCRFSSQWSGAQSEETKSERETRRRLCGVAPGPQIGSYSGHHLNWYSLCWSVA